MIYLRDVTTIGLNAGSCNGCGVCTMVCPRGVLEMQGKKARIAERDACIECGACALNCVPGALTVKAGVGCASGILNGMLGRKSACCVVDGDDDLCTSC